MTMAMTDILIGAYGYPNNNCKGRSYVVFGGAGVGNSGVIRFVQSQWYQRLETGWRK